MQKKYTKEIELFFTGLLLWFGIKRIIKGKSKLSRQEWNEYFYGHWNFSGEKQDKHLAPFPEELPKRLIKMFSFVDDTVLDPFLGSGTTSVAAMKLARNSIGYEINAGYLPTIEKRLKDKTSIFEQQAEIEIGQQEKPASSFEKEIQNLPYIFTDHVAFERKVDPKVLNFGSKIDHCRTSRIRDYTVDKVVSPSKLILSKS